MAFFSPGWLRKSGKILKEAAESLSPPESHREHGRVPVVFRYIRQGWAKESPVLERVALGSVVQEPSSRSRLAVSSYREARGSQLVVVGHRFSHHIWVTGEQNRFAILNCDGTLEPRALTLSPPPEVLRKQGLNHLGLTNHCTERKCSLIFRRSFALLLSLPALPTMHPVEDCHLVATHQFLALQKKPQENLPNISSRRTYSSYDMDPHILIRAGLLHTPKGKLWLEQDRVFGNPLSSGAERHLVVKKLSAPTGNVIPFPNRRQTGHLAPFSRISTPRHRRRIVSASFHSSLTSHEFELVSLCETMSPRFHFRALALKDVAWPRKVWLNRHAFEILHTEARMLKQTSLRKEAAPLVATDNHLLNCLDCNPFLTLRISSTLLYETTTCATPLEISLMPAHPIPEFPHGENSIKHRISPESSYPTPILIALVNVSDEDEFLLSGKGTPSLINQVRTISKIQYINLAVGGRGSPFGTRPSLEGIDRTAETLTLDRILKAVRLPLEHLQPTSVDNSRYSQARPIETPARWYNPGPGASTTENGAQLQRSGSGILQMHSCPLIPLKALVFYRFDFARHLTTLHYSTAMRNNAKNLQISWSTRELVRTRFQYSLLFLLNLTMSHFLRFGARVKCTAGQNYAVGISTGVRRHYRLSQAHLQGRGCHVEGSRSYGVHYHAVKHVSYSSRELYSIKFISSNKGVVPALRRMILFFKSFSSYVTVVDSHHTISNQGARLQASKKLRGPSCLSSRTLASVISSPSAY
ncbi:uncharacterized protein BDR25DRAFT_353766 [Lindgomyces ingoldianus]|uniref:Uncharacterized protein n=1 Tax=Lindgomyces ingoldianus TaxID=673940 RepID=A0ACB6QYP9_9PLEO|nr:uncharacterized protein BDR25DRAFT_353766 [Lindgomyces ingoldianus]KAF2472016.1 hypothetical protein BDR25DRAFT_353766 [Lindgomyces ingoldianus]